MTSQCLYQNLDRSPSLCWDRPTQNSKLLSVTLLSATSSVSSTRSTNAKLPFVHSNTEQSSSWRHSFFAASKDTCSGMKYGEKDRVYTLFLVPTVSHEHRPCFQIRLLLLFRFSAFFFFEFLILKLYRRCLSPTPQGPIFQRGYLGNQAQDWTAVCHVCFPHTQTREPRQRFPERMTQTAHQTKTY